MLKWTRLSSRQAVQHEKELGRLLMPLKAAIFHLLHVAYRTIHRLELPEFRDWKPVMMPMEVPTDPNGQEQLVALVVYRLFWND
jgi:hypothetical protein